MCFACTSVVNSVASVGSLAEDAEDVCTAVEEGPARRRVIELDVAVTEPEAGEGNTVTLHVPGFLESVEDD